MILATLLVSSQVLVAAPLAVFAEETTSSEGISAISQTIETSSSAATETASSETATATTESKERLQINAVAIGNALTKEQETYTLDQLGIKGETPIYTTSGSDSDEVYS
jgi:hypothetical protein